MSHVHPWLLALAFVLGLALTLAFMIRRVKREVPSYGAAGLAAQSETSKPVPSKSVTSKSLAENKSEVIARPTEDEAKTEVFSRPKVEEAKTEAISIPKAAAATGAAGFVGAAALAGAGGKSDEKSTEEPYGAGSFRAVGGAKVPSGWTIKGNEDSMLYHTTDSPSYGQTIAELWFRDPATAEAAGFTHWQKGREGSGIATLAAAEPEVPPGPHGPGSAAPGAGGTGPSGWTIKGNEDSMLFHTTDSPSYKRTRAEVWFRDEATAIAAGFTHWKEGRKKGASGAAKLAATEQDVPPGPHGLGSTKPNADGTGPSGWSIKGNEESKLYHSPESPSFGVTRAEVWFRDVETAEAAGFNRWDSGKSQRGKK